MKMGMGEVKGEDESLCTCVSACFWGQLVKVEFINFFIFIVLAIK